MSHLASQQLRDRLAVVTGASSGIGRAIAVELAAAGADVFVHGGRNRQGAEDTAETVRQQGASVRLVLADLADPDQQGRLVEQAWAWQGKVDIWINNAGVDLLTGEAASWPFARKLQALLEVDVAATVHLARAAGRRMQEARSGVILNMGWDGADRGMAGDSGELFATAKGAIMAFTRSLARSLAPEVRVNCLAPGWIKTAWGQGASEDWQRRAVAESLLGRWGTPEDVAAVARFLVSPAASFITGQIVEINGGFAGG